MLASDAPDLDTLAAELRRDGVVVDRVMGTGEAAESHDRIAALIREVPFPVYVALTRAPRGTTLDARGAGSEVLASLLHRRIGGKGLYVVATPDTILDVTAFGLDVDPTLLSLSFYENAGAIRDAAREYGAEHLVLAPVVEAEAVVREAEALVEQTRREPPGWEATLEPDEADELARRAVALVDRARWYPGQPTGPLSVRTASGGLSAAWGVAMGMFAASIALVVTRSLPGRSLARTPAGRSGRTPSDGAPQPPDPEAELEVAEAGLEALRASIDERAGRAPKDTARWEQALLARDLAELLVGDARGARSGLTAIGAQVVVRTAERDLARAFDGRRRGTYRPCFFDPRHGHVGAVTRWRLDQGTVEVPSCTRCRRAAAAGREPESLLRPSRRGGPRPYWHDDDVWARTGFGAIEPELVRVLMDARRELA